jgi:hypothetical protein
VTGPRVLLRPSGKRQAARIGLGLWIGAFGVGGLLWGAWPLALVTLAIAGWLFVMAALIAFRPRSYELHLDRRGFACTTSSATWRTTSAGARSSTCSPST